jgi:hypothetical protein
MAHVEDVNGDGFDDLVLQIEDVAGTFTSGSGTATLTGHLFDGTPFEGSDDICVVPSAPLPPPPPPPPPDEEAPVISGLQPPDESPLFVWNPDLGVDYTAGSPAVIDITRLCGPFGTFPPDPTECESLMFEAVDLGTGVEEVGCGLAYPNACDDANGDGNFIVARIVDGPATCDGGAGCDDELLITDDAGTAGDDMFQAYFCDGPNVDAPNCDGTDDGAYTVRVLVSDQASPQNNVAALDYSFVLDVTPPIISFGGIAGLQASNAATVDFVLTASVVDRNGNGTAVTSAVVQVTVNDAGLGDPFSCNLVTEAATGVTPEGGNDDASGNTVIADVTSQVNANSGDFSQRFTAANLGAGGYTYCFEITADDGAERKDGSDDGLDISALAAKDFTWQ